MMNTNESPTSRPTLSELVTSSYSEEISKISEALREGKNVLISGKFVTGKTTLAQEILRLAEEGKVWQGESAGAVYSHTKYALEGDSMFIEAIGSFAGKKQAVIVMDEVGGGLCESDGSVNKDLVNRFLKLVSEYNEKGVNIIAVGSVSPSLADAIKVEFPTIIDFQNPPKTMGELDFKIFQESNREFGDTSKE